MLPHRRYFSFSTFVCLLLSSLAGLFFFASTPVAYAGSSDVDIGPTPNDKICVVGTLISHDEQPLADGWSVVATPRNDQGELDSTRAISAVSNANGDFRFDERPDDPGRGIFVGDWQFQVDLAQKDGQEWEAVTPNQFDLALDYGAKDCTRIRFKLRRIFKVTVIKVNEEYVGQGGWHMRAEPGPGNNFADPQELVTDDTGTVIFKLSPGRWIFTEAPPPGLSYVPILPPSGLQDVDVRSATTLYFKNRIRYPGCIDVFKQDVTPNNTQRPLPGWEIKVLRTDGSIAASGLTDLEGKVRFVGLQPGPYNVVEEKRTEWKPITPTSFAVVVHGGDQCETVTFFNVQSPPQFCIEGLKIDTNGKIGIPGWKIWAEPLDNGGFQPTPVMTNGAGEYKFVFPDDDYRIPGARYKICEEQKDGWLPHTSTCYIVQLPKEPGECVRVPTFENQQKGHVVDDHKPDHGKPDRSVCQSIHTVKRGESLYGIGKHYNVPAKVMIDANPWVRNQWNMYLYVGQQLCIP